MQHASLSRLIVWFPVLALALVAGLLIKRRTYRELPFFFLYVLYALLVGGVRFLALSLGRTPYFYTYWISELAGTIVVSLAMYELFLHRLFARFRSSGFYRHLFPFAALALLLVTVTAGVLAQDKQSMFVNASRHFDFLRTAVLVFFTALMLFMGRNWNRYELGIAAGFALQAAVALANAAAKTRSGNQSIVLDTVELLTYDLSCLIWLITFSKPLSSPMLHIDDAANVEMLRKARVWEVVLKNWLAPK